MALIIIQLNKMSKPIYNSGDRIFNTEIRKTGTIKCLRDNSREKELRCKNSSHYYYFIDYDDGTFDTYVYGLNLISEINSI